MTPRQVIDELQALDLQNPGAWPQWAHHAAVAAVAVLILALGGYALVAPAYDDLGAARLQEQTLRHEFEVRQKKVAALDAYKAQLAQMQRDFGDMLRQLPSKSEVASLLSDISQTRSANSLDEELFQPEPEIPREFYAELPNRIVVTGSYHQMGQFVSGVAALPRIVVIDEVEIKPATPSTPFKAGDSAHNSLRMTALAKTYRYLDASEIAAKSATAAGAPR